MWVTDTMGDSKRVTVYGGTAAETRAKAAQIRARVAEGQPAKDRKQTVKAYAQQWIETSLEASDRKRTTKTLYAGVARTHIFDSAIGRLTLTGPLFLLLFASTYFLMSQADAGNFNVGGLTRGDTLYFTVTIFTTVGFGDILAASHSARALVTAQMILDLILIGAVIRAFVDAVRIARKNSTTPPAMLSDQASSSRSPPRGPSDSRSLACQFWLWVSPGKPAHDGMQHG